MSKVTQKLALDRSKDMLYGMARCTQDPRRIQEIQGLMKSVRTFLARIDGMNYDPADTHLFCLYIRGRMIALQLNPSTTSQNLQFDA